MYPEDDRCYRTLALCDVVTGEISSDMFELKVIELKKKPVENGTAITDWIRFFSGTSKEEIRMLAEKNNYLNLGYELLEQLSADERKRLEERAEQKAIRDYHDIVMGAEQRGLERGINNLITACHSLGATKDYIVQQIVDSYHLTLEEAAKKVDTVLS